MKASTMVLPLYMLNSFCAPSTLLKTNSAALRGNTGALGGAGAVTATRDPAIAMNTSSLCIESSLLDFPASDSGQIGQHVAHHGHCRRSALEILGDDFVERIR